MFFNVKYRFQASVAQSGRLAPDQYCPACWVLGFAKARTCWVHTTPILTPLCMGVASPGGLQQQLPGKKNMIIARGCSRHEARLLRIAEERNFSSGIVLPPAETTHSAANMQQCCHCKQAALEPSKYDYFLANLPICARDQKPRPNLHIAVRSCWCLPRKLGRSAKVAPKPYCF